MLTLDIVIGLFTIYYTIQVVDSFFSPESLLQGLRFILRVNVDAQAKPQSKKSSNNGFLVHLDSMRADLLRALYFFKDYALIVFIACILLFNHMLDYLWKYMTHGKETYFTFGGAIVLILFTSKANITIALKRGFKSTEATISVWLSVASFVLSFAFIHQRNYFLSFDLHGAYQKLRMQLDTYSEPSIGLSLLPSDPILFELLLAILCSLITFTLYSATIRFIRSHVHLGDFLMESQYSASKLSLIKVLSFMNVFLPLLYISMWVVPIQHAFTFNLLTDSASRRVQLLLLYTIALLRIIALRPYVQSYLLSPATLVISKVRVKTEEDIKLMQQQVINFLKYLMIATIHLITFPLLIFGFGVMLNSKAKYSILSERIVDRIFTLFYMDKLRDSMSAPFQYLLGNSTSASASTIQDAPETIHTSDELTNVSYFYGQTVSFLIWWTCLAHMIISIVAFIYFSKIDKPKAGKTNVAKETPQKAASK